MSRPSWRPQSTAHAGRGLPMPPERPRAVSPPRGLAVSHGPGARSPRPGWPIRSAPEPAAHGTRSRLAPSWRPTFPTTEPHPRPWSRCLPGEAPAIREGLALLILLAEEWWRGFRPQGLAIDQDSVAANPEYLVRTVRVGQVSKETAVCELVETDRLGHGQDSRGGHSDTRKALLPFKGRPSAQRGVQLVIERIAILLPALPVAEPGIGNELRHTYLSAQCLELLLLVGGDVQRPVGRVEGPGRRG